MKRVSEIITINEIRARWNNGDMITIMAGTGVGKSYFVKNILYAFAKENGKKILMLIHRKNCVNQFRKELERDRKTNTIDVKTYQHLENRCKNRGGFDFSQYEYIVCDEFHYFISDSAFNKTTDISLNVILKQTNKTKIFMSATGDYVKKYLNNIKNIETIDYELPINYEFIKSLSFFYKDETLEELIKEVVKKDIKAIFFIKSAEKAYDIYKKYKKYCLFNCSKSNRRYYRYVDEEKIDTMLQEEMFEEKILVTTTCLDSGVNIVDTNVKYIVVDVDDIGSLIQCIGRKRIQNENDRIDVYIKAITGKQLGGKKTQLKKRIQMADYLRKHTVREYIEVYGRELDYSNIVYDDVVGEEDKGTKKINELMYFKCQLDIYDIDTIKTYGEFGYCGYLANMLGFVDYDNYNYKIIELEYEKSIVKAYLDSIVGKKLFAIEQKELTQLLISELKGIKNKYRIRGEKVKFLTLKKIIRDELKLDYDVSIPKAETKGEMRNKKYIKISKIP